MLIVKTYIFCDDLPLCAFSLSFEVFSHSSEQSQIAVTAYFPTVHLLHLDNEIADRVGIH